MIFTLIATAAFGLEGLVRRELTELGFDSRAENGYVRFEGTLEDAFKANLWLRTADRVLILMAEGTVMTFEDLSVWCAAAHGRSSCRETPRSPSAANAHEAS